jgi:hypothetical protein
MDIERENVREIQEIHEIQSAKKRSAYTEKKEEVEGGKERQRVKVKY